MGPKAGIQPAKQNDATIDGERAILRRAERVTADDPFATFSEWDSEADREGYEDL